MNRRTEPIILILIAFIATMMRVGVATAQTPVSQTVTPSPTALPTPSSTPSLEQRLDVLESQVSDLDGKTVISQLDEIVGIIQGVVTVIAITLSGIWGYNLFVRQRQRYPRASLVHHITHKFIGHDKLLLRVTVTISNKGNILLSLASLETAILQVLPLPTDVTVSINEGLDPVPDGETEVVWPTIAFHEPKWEKGKCEIEPNESQEIYHDFILDAKFDTIAVYTYLQNERKKKHDRTIGWDLTTLYDIRGVEKTPVEAVNLLVGHLL